MMTPKILQMLGSLNTLTQQNWTVSFRDRSGHGIYEIMYEDHDDGRFGKTTMGSEITMTLYRSVDASSINLAIQNIEMVLENKIISLLEAARCRMYSLQAIGDLYGCKLPAPPKTPFKQKLPD